MFVRKLPNGGAGSGVNPEGTDYPFVDPSPGVRHIFADAYLSYRDRTLVPPFRLSWLHGFREWMLDDSEPSVPDTPGSILDPLPVHVIVRDAADTIVLQTTELPAEAYRTGAWNERLRWHEWTTADVVFRLLQHTAWGESITRDVPNRTISPGRSELDARTVELVPARVNSLSYGEQLTGPILFQNGYNTEWVVTPITRPDRFRRVTRVTLHAAAGGGRGRYPACDDPRVVLRTINGVRANAYGGFLLAAQDCYAIRQPTQVTAGDLTTSRVVPATLQLINNCQPCCSCDDFVNTYQAVKKVWSRFKVLGQRATTIKNTLQDNIDRWEASRTCRNTRLVRVTAVSFAGRYMEVAASICNNSDACIYDVVLNIHLAFNGVGDYTSDLVPCTGFITDAKGDTIGYNPGGSHPDYVARFDVLRPSSAGVVRFRLTLTPAPNVGVSVTVTANATVGGAAWPTDDTPAEASQTLSFKSC